MSSSKRPRGRPRKTPSSGDVLKQLTEENIRISEQLMFANKCLKVLITFKSFVDFISHKFMNCLDSNEWQKFETLRKDIEEVFKQRNNSLNAETNESICEQISVKEEIIENQTSNDLENDTNFEQNINFIGNTEINEISNTNPMNEVFKSSAESLNEELITSNDPKSEQTSAEEQNIDNHSMASNSSSSEDNAVPDDNYECERVGSSSQDSDSDDTNQDQSIRTQHKRLRSGRTLANTSETETSGPFKCETCAKEYRLKYSLEKHIRVQHILQPNFKCDVEGCGKIFKQNWRLIEHKIKTHRMSSSFQCTYEGCAVALKNRNSLRAHINTKHGGVRYQCDWPGCGYHNFRRDRVEKHKAVHRPKPNGKTFRLSSYLSEHKISSHSSSTNNTLECPHEGCSAAFRHQGSLNIHIKEKHLGIKYSCDWPGCSYSNVRRDRVEKHKAVHRPKPDGKIRLSSYLMEHKINSNLSAPNIQCPYEGCSTVLKHKSSLHSHIKDKHLGIRYSCDWPGCQYKHSRRDKLELHKAIHSTERNYVCDVEGCGKAFKLSSRLNEHKSFAHLFATVQCTYEGCNALLKHERGLKEHISAKHSARKQYKCDWPGCNYKNIRRDRVEIHKSVHSSERKFLCDWPDCGKAFKHRVILKIHYRKHILSSNNKEMSCEWPGCDFKYLSKSSLERHLPVHSTERTFACNWPECGKTYKHKLSLIQHTNSHTNERLYVCEWPGCEFTSYGSSNYFCHKKIHKKNFKNN